MNRTADDQIECLECGRWFRAVANHVYPAHGMTSDEYRLRHAIPMSDPLTGSDTTARRKEAAHRRLDADPTLMERMWARGAEVNAQSGGSGRRGPSQARDAGMARRHQTTEAKWEEDLARNGWSSWHEAADWAIDENVGWAEVATLLGRSERPVQMRAQQAGAPILDRRITPKQDQLLALARRRFDETGTLFRASPHKLSEWLSIQRRFAARGQWRRVHIELDKIDPDWVLHPSERINPPCTMDGCQTPRESLGLCKAHYHRELNRQRRNEAIDPTEQIECLECGEWFRSVGTHVRQVHGLSAAQYRARHGIADATAMNSAAVLAKRQQDASTPEAVKRLKQAQVARWGGTPDELWARRFKHAGWSGWDDAIAWAAEHNHGIVQIAERLGCSKNTVRRGCREAGVVILPTLTEGQMHYLELARAHVAEHGDLTRPHPADLAQWLSSTRYAAKLASAQNRCYLALDELDPAWRIPDADRGH